MLLKISFLSWLAWYHAWTGNPRGAAEAFAAATEVKPC